MLILTVTNQNYTRYSSYNFDLTIQPRLRHTGEEKYYHVSDMQPFIFDSALVDPLDIARRDHTEFFVEKILDHRGNIEFQVRWLGYDVSNDSWETYANLRNSEHLHAYLLDKNLTQLIPSKYR